MSIINKTTSLVVIRKSGPDGVNFKNVRYEKVTPTGNWKVVHTHDGEHDLYLEAYHTKNRINKTQIGHTKGLWGFFKRPIYEEYQDVIAGQSYYIHEKDLLVMTIYENDCCTTQQ